MVLKSMLAHTHRPMSPPKETSMSNQDIPPFLELYRGKWKGQHKKKQ